jgi:hypothetical protein
MNYSEIFKNNREEINGMIYNFVVEKEELNN